MSSHDMSPERIAAQNAEEAARLTETLRELDALSRQKILEAAAAEGWSDSQAHWLDILAKQTLFQEIADGKPTIEALNDAYATARRRLAVGYFENALNEGKNRITAFLTVVDLERQIAERRGDTPPDYPDAVLMAACEVVEAAAAQGLPSEQQIAAGFAEIAKRLEGTGADPVPQTRQ